MNHTQILRRAWNILWSYKAIWVFGILLALTSASGSGNGGSNGGGDNGGGGSGSLPGTLGQTINGIGAGLNQFFTHIVEPNLVPFILGFVLFILLLSAVFVIIRMVSEVALIRMVDGYEATGEKAGVRQGFRLGWSRAAWRIFLIDLVIGLPVAVVFIGLFGCAALPVLLSWIGRQEPTAAGIVATIGMFFLFIFLAVLVSAVISLVTEPIRRVCVLEDEGVIASIRRGWQLVRHNFWNVFLMWLILIGIRIAIGILLIPVFIALLLLAGVSGGGIGAGLWFLIHALGSDPAAWITGISVGLLLFILVLAIPMTFLEGLKQSYFSTTWTLTYRQLRPLPIAMPFPPAAEPPLGGEAPAPL
jgi:hypothetical protein